MVEQTRFSILSTENSASHIEMVDKFRGFAILYIIIIHTLEMWLNVSLNWVWGILWIIFDAFGAASFIFISGISISFFYHFQKEKVQTESNYFRWNFRIKYFSRTFCLGILALIMNTITYTLSQNILSFWLWDVLLTIAFARIVCYFFQ